jgi:hypothetical protein
MLEPEASANMVATSGAVIASAELASAALWLASIDCMLASALATSCEEDGVSDDPHALIRHIASDSVKEG